MARIPRYQGRAEPKITGSDTSDTYADRPHEESTDSDTAGTGERSTVGREKPRKPETSTDRVVPEREAGLGGGLDQAEEAQLGVTDEELFGEGSAAEEPERNSKRKRTP